MTWTATLVIALASLATAVVMHAEEPTLISLTVQDKLDLALDVRAEKQTADFILADLESQASPVAVKGLPAKGVDNQSGQTRATGPTEEGERKPQPGQELNVDLGSGVTMAFAWIPPGSFMMGSPDSEAGREQREGPMHLARLTEGFWLGKYEVTQEQYERVTGKNPSKFKAYTRPVEQVTWQDAVGFCSTVTASVGLRSKKLTCRLPTEAEWEYARRAGTTTRYSNGDRDNNLANAGWCQNNSGATTHPVGQKAPNQFGLYDMHGNVWEWCMDRLGDYPAGDTIDPQGAATGWLRALRGGSWNFTANCCRVAFRFYYYPGLTNSYFGFRVALSSSQQ